MIEGSLVKPMCCYLFLEPHINKNNQKERKKIQNTKQWKKIKKYISKKNIPERLENC
jgi:hypothetical protein